MPRENRKQGANRQRMRGTTEDTLFLQSRTGVLKVQVAVTPFPVVAAPPATGRGGARPLGQVWEERSPQVMAPEADGWGRKQDDRAWGGWQHRPERPPPPRNKKATRQMEKERENEN